MVKKLLKDFKEERQFIHELKDYIESKCNKMDDKLKRFPVKTLKIISKFRFKSGTKITVKDEEYLLVNALKMMREKYNRICTQSKKTYYNDVLRDFSKDIKTSEEKQSLLFLYKEDISKSFKQLDEDFLFCLYVIRELPKLIKEQAINDKKK